MLNEKDTMWVDLRHKHFADAINDISSQVCGHADSAVSAASVGYELHHQTLLGCHTMCEQLSRVPTPVCNTAA